MNRKFEFFSGCIAILIWALFTVALPAQTVRAECIEYRIVDYGDRIEAVCVGAPLTEEQKEEINQQALKQVEIEQKTEQTVVRGELAKRPDKNEQPQGTVILKESVDKTEVENVTVQSYEVKYLPSNNPNRGGLQRYGQYSVKIMATNNGRRGKIKFKLKQVDFSGFETESITVSEHFERDQQKTITTHVPAQAVPFVQSSEWIIEATKI